MKMDSPDMEIDDDNYEPSKNSKSPVKRDNLNNSKVDNTVSIKPYFILYVLIDRIIGSMRYNILFIEMSYFGRYYIISIMSHTYNEPNFLGMWF